MAKVPKIHTIKKTRRGRDLYIQGTVEALAKYYGYTLECGNSWNKKINRYPKQLHP